LDFVNLLPKKKGGCRFVLTYVCLASMWPEAVTLRNVSSKTVAQGIVEIFCRTAVPRENLANQGPSLMGRTYWRCWVLTLSVDNGISSPDEWVARLTSRNF